MSDRAGALAVGDTVSRLVLASTSGQLVIPDAGRWTLLGLMRSAGCPVCTLRYHELAKRAGELAELGVIAPLAFLSSEHELEQAELTASPTVPIVADPDGALHQRLGTTSSRWNVIRGLPHGLVSKERAGKDLQGSDAPPDTAPIGQMGADLLIDPAGRVTAAAYWRWPGDHLPIDTAMQHVRSSR